MLLLPRLARNLVLAFLVPVVLAWTALSQFIPLAPAQQATIRMVLPAGALLQLALAVWILRLFSAPLRAALAAKDPNPEQVLRAAEAGYRLPLRVAMGVLAVDTLEIGLVTFVLVGQDLPRDLSVAFVAACGAAAILTATLAYALVASAVGQGVSKLPPVVEFRQQGTVRGKILALGLGLLTVALLLFGSLGYARFRVAVDLDYQANVEHAQQGAIAHAHLMPDANIPELVWLSCGAPSALFSSGGRLLSQAGPGDVPWSALPRAIGVARLDGGAGHGWVMGRDAAGNGTVLLSWLPEGPLEARRVGFWSDLLVVGLLTYLAAALLVWFSARAITLPIQLLGQATQRVAAGDLGASPASVTRDEMGRLAADFRRMAQGLTFLVGAVQEATRGVAQAARELSDIGDRVKAGALGQHDGAISANAAVEAMQTSMTLVGKGIRGLSEYVTSTSAAVGQTAAALDAVQRQGSELQQAMDFAAKDVAGLAEAGDKAQVALRALDQIADRTGETLGKVNTTLSGLELGAVASQLNAAQAEELAQVAASVVEETVRGIESVRAAVGDAQRRVTALGRRAGDIDQIVDFIADVAGRTNLLSLNASIIATQAGEHGKAFAVVADQIRELAAQIASSTKSIGDIIRAVRDDVEGTAALISRGDALAADGVRLAQNSARSLVQIRGATTQGSESAARIQAAVQGHVQSTREISDLVAMVADGSHSVSEAFQRIGSSVTALQNVNRSVGTMAERLSKALDQQTALGKGQLQALERMNVMIEGITGALAEHGAATQRVRESLENLGRASARHETSVKDLSDLGERLQGRAANLAERVGRFKV